TQPLTLNTVAFFAAAKKVTAAPHRGSANRPTRKRDPATTPKRQSSKAPKLKNQKAPCGQHHSFGL
ncbi:hypothetical protein QCE49_06290, partial [Caballeronia sp. LZ008]|nr:hypothetical protein [Caballeronia sp. LZ008]